MKYTKRLLISMSFFAFLLTVSGCTNEEEIGSDSKEHPAIQTIRATKSDFITTQEVNVPLTRTTIDGYKTTFNSGDKIGLFAIKDGAIVDNVNNIALTCTVTTDDTNSSTNWTLPTDTKIYYYEGVTYIAYYPYNENVTIDASITKEEIIKSLVDNSYLQPKDNQSATDGSDHAASDLMIATASAIIDKFANITLTLNFEHQFSLFVLKPQAISIFPPDNSGFTYCKSAYNYNIDPNVTDVSLFGTIKPLKMPNNSFRAIIKAETLDQNKSIAYNTIGYGNNSKSIFVDGSSIKLNKGQYYELEAKTPITSKDAEPRPLKPGDFVFHGKTGIEIYPGDGELTSGKIPYYSQAVGIVVTCDPNRMTDEVCNKKDWNHAYVIGFVTGDAHTWGRIQDEDFLDNCTTQNGAKDNMKGYTETNSLKNLAENFPIYQLTLVGQIRKNNPVPNGFADIRSDWFIPSVGQYYDLLNNLCGKAPDDFETKTESSWTENTNAGTMYSTLQNQYAKVGKSLDGCFWSSSEYNTSNAWYLNISSSQIKLGITSKGTWDTQKVTIYGFFAF